MYVCIKAYKVGGVQKSLSKPIISILKSQQPDVSNHPYQMWCQIYVKATKQTHTLDGWYFLRNCKYKTHTFFDPWILFSYIFVWLLAYDVFQVSSKWMCDVYFCEIRYPHLYVRRKCYYSFHQSYIPIFIECNHHIKNSINTDTSIYDNSSAM